MKIKTIGFVFALLCISNFVYAQTMEITGEVKTGLFWERVNSSIIDRFGVEHPQVEEQVRIHNNDDAGGDQGRFRLNMHLKNENLGMKIRFQQTVWGEESDNVWDFAFVYGNFIDEQLRIVFGRLGESPWSAGGPDIWQELDNQVGIRTEFSPKFLPALEGLKVGFVLNGWNQANYFDEHNTLVDILKETVVGATYTNDYVHARVSYRFDGESDVYNHDWFDGTDMMYRLEEKVLRNLFDNHDIRVWVNGWWRGIGSEDDDIVNFQNWLYTDWYTGPFTTQLRLGYHTGVLRREFQSRLGLSYKIPVGGGAEFVPGIAGIFRIDFGDIEVKDVKYKLFSVEPQLRLNFNSKAYISMIYFFENEPLSHDRNKRTQRANLRTVFTF